MNLASGFFGCAREHASRPALMVDGRHLSYDELARWSLRIAATIRRAADSSERLAAVFARRSVSAYAGILGVLHSGRGYVPLNPRFPIARTAAMLERAGCTTIVVGVETLALLDGLLESAVQPLTLILPEVPRDKGLIEKYPKHSFHFADELFPPTDAAGVAEVAADEVAYLLFTSGSTGEPKGVPVSNSNVRSYVDHVVARYQVGPDDRLSQTFDLTFDLSVHDMFVAWEAGACLCCLPESLVSAPAKFIRDQKLTMWFSVPSTISFMSRLRLLRPDVFPSLRLSLFCGEALPESSAMAWQEAAPNSLVENLYGPTEATIAITSYRWDPVGSPARCKNGVVPIGWPFAGQQVCVVDEQFRPVSQGEAGELLLAGSQVTSGYWKSPEITQQRYVRISPDDGLIWYRTGDRAAIEPDGCLIYLGRFDSQVKIRGFRAELQEIESVLRKAAGTEQVAAIAWPVHNGNADGIVAFLCGPAERDVPHILARCRATLPDYMVPQTVRFLDDFPLNANGKVDRGKLAATLADGSP